MLEWIALVAVLLYFVSGYLIKRLIKNEGATEKGKFILYKSRSDAFPLFLAGWAIIYLINEFFHLTYSQFQDAILIAVLSVYIIQFVYLLKYRKQYQ
ncbi:hypothetical protein [Falsibacillus pallidus]|uniref:Uncharacterized protein n=1 Tax=Falsibacillus pallidus TaxID=493781 RepID=A0A370G2E2_9BACI|nr:hypothetical protein [Falsibacillus pallidus]RDI38041.1 hypothetical protein DFR59_11953 [Falsibacillus pallidus]